ncbi:hypothetical protein NMY22_g17679 [Coprinellus aureogranulatus]|nr:hypothetical protein NMY22_g17679 [Coprinellus aureogranulatus]
MTLSPPDIATSRTITRRTLYPDTSIAFDGAPSPTTPSTAVEGHAYLRQGSRGYSEGEDDDDEAEEIPKNREPGQESPTVIIGEKKLGPRRCGWWTDGRGGGSYRDGGVSPDRASRDRLQRVHDEDSDNEWSGEASGAEESQR